jgi:hypothetical protein
MATKHAAEDDAARIAELEAEVQDLKHRLAKYGALSPTLLIPNERDPRTRPGSDPANIERQASEARPATNDQQCL